MGGWQLILWGAVMAAGTLLFLRLVADEIELTEEDVRHFETTEHKAYKRRLQEAAAAGGEEEIETVQAA